MDILVAYDVSTVSTDGARRLRRVAKICQGYGQRVQESLFECRVNDAQKELFVSKLLGVIDDKVDNLRIYHLRGGREGAVESYGLDKYVDFGGNLIV